MDNLENKSASALEITLRIFSAFFIIVFFVFSGFVFNASRNRDKSAGEDYVDIENGFTVSYPKGWHIEKSDTSLIKSKNQTSISFTNLVGDIAGKFLGSANFKIFFNYAEGQLNLDMYKNIVKSNMSRNLNDFVVLKEEKIYVNNLEGYLILASDKGEKTNGAVLNPSYKSLFFITTEEKSNREFLIWATAFDLSWSKYEKLFENCIKSFKIPE